MLHQSPAIAQAAEVRSDLLSAGRIALDQIPSSLWRPLHVLSLHSTGPVLSRNLRRDCPHGRIQLVGKVDALLGALDIDNNPPAWFTLGDAACISDILWHSSGNSTATRNYLP